MSAVSSGAFTDLPSTWEARAGESGGKTSPEELIAAAHAFLLLNGSVPRSVPCGNACHQTGGERHCDIRGRWPGTKSLFQCPDRARRGARRRCRRVPGSCRGCQRRLPDLQGASRQRCPERHRTCVGAGPAGCRRSLRCVLYRRRLCQCRLERHSPPSHALRQAQSEPRT